MAGDPFSEYLARKQARDPFNTASPDDPADVHDVDQDQLDEAEKKRLAALGSAPARSSGPSSGSTHGPLRSIWDTISSPLRATAGLTGTSLVHALGIRAMFPEAYKAAHEENLAAEANRAGPDLLNEAAALPGVGDVAAQAFTPEFKESPLGRFVAPTARLAGNILGDPTTYIGAGLLSRVPAAAKALGRGEQAYKALVEAGKVEEAAAMLPRLREIALGLGEAEGAESKIGQGARRFVESLGTPGATGEAIAGVRMAPSFTAAVRGVGRAGLTLPFSPLVGVAYAPELAEGIGSQAGEAVEQARAGRYAEAAASGAGALLTGGLALLVGKGVLHEADAARALERGLAAQLGEEPRPAVMPREEVQLEPPPAAAPVTARAAEEAAPAVAPATPAEVTPPPPAQPPASPVVEPPLVKPAPPEIAPLEGHDKIQVTRSPVNTQKALDLIEAKSSAGEELRRADLVKAGLASAKQVEKYGIERILDAHGATQQRGRLELTPGGGFRVRAAEIGPPAGAPAATLPAAPAGAPAAPPPVAGETPVVTAAAMAQPPPRTARADIDQQLNQPELRALVDQNLQSIADQARKPLDSLTRVDISAAFPAPEQKPIRAVLMRALEAGKHARKMEAIKAAGGPGEPSGALTAPGEGRQPFRTPPELMPAPRAVQPGISPEERLAAGRGLREPTGIGEREPVQREPVVHAINTQADLDAAREQLRGMKIFTMAHPHVLDEFSDDIVKLEDDILSAIHRGVGIPEMPTPERAARPEQPEPQPYTGTGVSRESVPRVPEAVPEIAARYAAGQQETPLSMPRRNRYTGTIEEGQTRPTLTPGQVPPESVGAVGREEALRRAVGQHMVSEPEGRQRAGEGGYPGGVGDPTILARRAQQVLGRDLNSVSPEQLSTLFTLADKNPRDFGVPERALDPQLVNEASDRLMGGTSHLGEEGSASRVFEYDPASPAGQMQDRARKLASGGFAGAEDALQDTMTRWLQDLHLDDARFLQQGEAKIEALKRRTADQLEGMSADDAAGLLESVAAQAAEIRAKAQRTFDAARHRRLLLTGGDGSTVDEARAELVRMLHTDLTHRANNYRKREATRTTPIDDLIKRSMGSGLSAADADRLAVRPEEVEAPPPAGASGAGGPPATEPTFPRRPADVKPTDWAERVRRDPILASQLRDILKRAYVSKKAADTLGGGRTGRKGVQTPWMADLSEMAKDLGVPVSSGRAADRLFTALDKKLRPEGEPRGAVTGAADLLTDQLVAERGPAWDAAVQRGLPIGDTGTRVVDFEGDVPALTRALHAADPSPLVSTLARVTQDVAATLNAPAHLAGLTASPQLNAVNLDPHAAVSPMYLNPLHARYLATTELSSGGLKGEALARAVDHRTAQNMADMVVHEAAHRKARHDAAAGDADFITAYTGALRELGPRYGEMVNEIRDAGVAPMSAKLDAMMPQYSEALKGAVNAEGAEAGLAAGAAAGRAAGHAAGPGEGVTPPYPPGRGGDQGGAAGGVEPGVRPIRPIPPGAPVPPAGAGASPSPRQGAAAGGAEPLVGAGGSRAVDAGGRAAGAGGAPASGPRPSASLTGVLSERLAANRKERVFRQLQTAYATNMARFTGNPADAERYMAEIEKIKTLPTDVREKLRTAKPGGAVDVGKNLTKLAHAGWSDEQLEQLGLSLAMRNHMQDRATPMTDADIKVAARKLMEHFTPEEFIDFTKLKGMRDPADWAFLNSVAATAGGNVEMQHALARRAEQDIEAAIRTGNTDAHADAVQRLEAAHGEIARGLMARDSAIATLIPETTRVARVLAAQRGMIHPLTAGETFRSRFLGMMRTSGIKKTKADELYQMVADLARQGVGANSTEFINAFRKATQPRYFDKFLEFWKAGLLGIPTQITNIGTNAMFLGLRNAENAVSSLASVFFSGLTGKPRERFIGETAARMTGGTRGFGEAWRWLKDDLSEIAKLHAVDPLKRLEQGTFFDDPNLRQLYGAIEGKKGEFVRIPFKLLDSFDNFFKHIIRNQEWAAQSHKLAQSPSAWSHSAEGVGNATARIYDELRTVASDPISHQNLWKKPGYKEALKAGRDIAIEDTFQQALVGTPVREAARAYQQATNRLPALQLLTPFFKTPYNILAEAMKRTPVAAVWAMKEYKAGRLNDAKFVEALVKSAMGTAVMGMMAEAAMSGTVTGGGPTDPKQVELLKRTGWQPYSIKVGNQYLSYQRLAPFSVMFGIAADMAEAWKRKDIDTASELLSKGVASATDNVLNQSFLQGLSSTVDILSDPQRKGVSAIRQLQSSLVPNVVGVVPVAHLARALDPTYRETEAFTLSPMQAQIPGLSQYLQPQLTPTGEPRERKGSPLERLLSPIARSPVETGPIAEAAAEIARVGPALTSPPLFFRVGEERVYYTPEERQEVARAQERAMGEVARLIRSPGYAGLPDTEDLATAGQRTKRDAITTIVNRYRRPTTERVNRQAMRRARMEQVASR